MASINITIPDAVLSRVTDAFAATYPGQTPKQVLIQFIKDTTRNHESADAAATQAATTDSEINPS